MPETTTPMSPVLQVVETTPALLLCAPSTGLMDVRHPVLTYSVLFAFKSAVHLVLLTFYLSIYRCLIYLCFRVAGALLSMK